MKKIITLLALSLVLVSCNKNTEVIVDDIIVNEEVNIEVTNSWSEIEEEIKEDKIEEETSTWVSIKENEENNYWEQELIIIENEAEVSEPYSWEELSSEEINEDVDMLLQELLSDDFFN